MDKPKRVNNKLREEAGKLGASAIILGVVDDSSAGDNFVSAMFGGDADRKA